MLRARRTTALATLTVGVLLLHGLALDGMALRGVEKPAAPVASMQVRQVRVAAAPIAAPIAAPARAEPTPVAPMAKKANKAAPARESASRDAVVDAPTATAPVAPLSSDVPAAAPFGVDDTHAAEVASASASAAAHEPPSPSTENDEPELINVAQRGAPLGDSDMRSPEVPTYPTVLPPPVQLAYTLRRGLLTGEGTFHWQADGRRYEARLAGSVAGISVLDWTSRGVIDEAGAAPERFVVRRRGRDPQAANFQRAAGKITFSGPTIEYPLVAGAQDRLSWMVQLPAIVAARPARFAAVGARILIFVAGARGDADVWTFVVQGSERLVAAGGDRQALKLLREPRKPYDTRVEVWLDPGLHYLPLKARLTPTGRDGDALELSRDTAAPLPTPHKSPAS